MTNYDRVSVIVGMILIGVVLLLVLEIPARVFEFRPFGTPLTFHITGNGMVSILLVGLACVGTDAIIRIHPQVRRHAVRHTYVSWILPGLMALALTILLPKSPNLLYWLIGLVVGGGILAWLILTSYHILDSNRRSIALAQAVLRLLAYVLALIFFSNIYRTRLRSLVSATAITLTAGLISLSILQSTTFPPKQPTRRIVLYASLIGLILGETTWALNYWQADALTVGVLLMLIFYILTGIAYEYVYNQINRRVVAEFLAVAALGVWVVIRFGPR
jgi:hypothetical protein